MAYKLEVLKASVDGTTGHHMVDVRILEYDDQDKRIAEGVPERYGIDHQALKLKHNDSVDNWLNYIAQEMCAKHERRTRIHHELISMAGRIVDVEETP